MVIILTLLCVAPPFIHPLVVFATSPPSPDVPTSFTPLLLPTLQLAQAVKIINGVRFPQNLECGRCTVFDKIYDFFASYGAPVFSVYARARARG